MSGILVVVGTIAPAIIGAAAAPKYLKLSLAKLNGSFATEPSPAELCLYFLKQIEDADENSPFSKYSPEMINSQCASMYRVTSEELVELIIDILRYKKIVTNDKKCSLEEIKSFAERMRSGKPDKIDKILIKSFDLMIEYNIEQSKLENNL